MHILNFVRVVELCYFVCHSHKKRKDSLETRAAFSWILILTWNFGGGPSDSASTFFKSVSAICFWCSYNCNWVLDMLGNYNVISANAPLCVLVCLAIAYITAKKIWEAILKFTQKKVQQMAYDYCYQKWKWEKSLQGKRVFIGKKLPG